MTCAVGWRLGRIGRLVEDGQWGCVVTSLVPLEPQCERKAQVKQGAIEELILAAKRRKWELREALVEPRVLQYEHVYA